MKLAAERQVNPGPVPFLKDGIFTALMVGVGTVSLNWIIYWSGSYDIIGGIYVLAVVLVARYTSGYFWGIAASVAGVLCTNYFFMAPFHVLDFYYPEHFLTFLSMLAASLITSTSTVRLKENARLALQRERRAKTLDEFTQKLLTARGNETIARLTLEYLFQMLHRSVAFYIGDPAAGGENSVHVNGGGQERIFFSASEREAAHGAFSMQKPTGTGTEIAPSVEGHYLPVVSQGHVLGVVGYHYTDGGKPEENMLTFLDMLILQSAMALEQQRLSDEQQAIVIEAEKEKMRTNLLRSVSHDLRTPLTGIVGASSAILENQELIDPQARDSLISDIHGEAQWLIRMVENLLAVTRISGVPAKVIKQPEAAEEIAAESVARVKKNFPDAEIHVTVPEEFLTVPMDATLIEQVLINLLENAQRHAGSDQPVRLNIRTEGGWAVFEVRDKGKGLPAKQLSHVFDGYGLENSDSTRGAGLGLSICKSIIDAHGGRITAANMPQGGAVFTFMLPLQEANPGDQ